MSRDHLTIVPPVAKLHTGKEHLNTLAERIIETIHEFVCQMDEADVPVTYAEIVGNLEFVKDDFKDQCRGKR